MRYPIALFLLASLLQVPVAPAQSRTIAIVGATVFDGTGAAPRQATVLIHDGRISGVGSGLQIPVGATVIHAEGLALLPGLFDLHTHLTASAVPSIAPDWAKAAKAYVLNGVTSVNEFGTYPETYEPERRLLKTFPSPHIMFAARITTPGGHGDEAGRGDFFSQEITTPREGHAAIVRLLPYRPDVIKIFTDGWRYGAAPDMTSMDEATVAATVEEAHKNNLPVLTHTLTLARGKAAARANVDVIAHGIQDMDTDAELVALMKQHGVSYAPTLAVFEPKGANAGKPSARWDRLMGSVAMMKAGMVPLTVGTDAGMTGTPHGTASLHELELLVKGGLTPAEALVAGTSASAKAIRVNGDRGTIEEGKRADLLLVEGEPWRTISDIRKTKRVFLDGVEVDREKLASEIAAPGPTPFAAIKATRVIDDFENPERSRLDTLRMNNTDPGTDHSRMMFLTIQRTATNHALSLSGQMSEKDNPSVRVLIPLSKGAVEPVDASAFHGVQFEARGDGEYSMVAPARTASWSGHFSASAKWHTVRIPFAALQTARKGVAWKGTDLQMIGFEIARPAGRKAWLEIDNVEFY